MQETETQRNIEALAELLHVERVHASVLDPGSDQPGDRAEAGAAWKRHAEASTHPVDVLLIVDRDNATRAAGLSEEAVEAVKRAHVKDAAVRETIRVEHSKAVAMIACDTRRVDPRRKRESVKPQRNRIARHAQRPQPALRSPARRRSRARHPTSQGSAQPRLHVPRRQLQSLVHTTFTPASQVGARSARQPRCSTSRERHHVIRSTRLRPRARANVATPLAEIAQRVSRLRRTQWWAATKPPVAKSQVPAAPLGNLRGLPNLAGGRQSGR